MKNVIPFRPKREAGQKEDSGTSRTRQNVIALCILVALLLGGLWLYRSLETYLRIEACVEAGRRNCDALVNENFR